MGLDTWLGGCCGAGGAGGPAVHLHGANAKPPDARPTPDDYRIQPPRAAGISRSQLGDEVARQRESASELHEPSNTNQQKSLRHLRIGTQDWSSGWEHRTRENSPGRYRRSAEDFGQAKSTPPSVHVTRADSPSAVVGYSTQTSSDESMDDGDSGSALMLWPRERVRLAARLTDQSSGSLSSNSRRLETLPEHVCIHSPGRPASPVPLHGPRAPSMPYQFRTPTDGELRESLAALTRPSRNSRTSPSPLSHDRSPSFPPPVAHGKPSERGGVALGGVERTVSGEVLHRCRQRLSMDSLSRASPAVSSRLSLGSSPSLPMRVDPNQLFQLSDVNDSVVSPRRSVHDVVAEVIRDVSVDSMSEVEKRGTTAAMIAAMAREHAARGECEAVNAQMWDDQEQLYYHGAHVTHHELRRPSMSAKNMPVGAAQP